jgi:uncharacterized membrane protein YfcA
MDVAGTEVSFLGVAVAGVIVGFVSGMFGVGGGFLLTPLLSVVFKIPMPIAVGTGLCQMIGTSMVALLRYRSLGLGESRFAAVLAGGSLFGVAAGARVVAALTAAGDVSIDGRAVSLATVVLYAAYAVFLASVALLLWWQGRSGFEDLEYVRRGPLARLRLPPYVDLPGVPMRHVSALVIAYVGLLIGLVSGLLGVGGGIVLIPILLYGFGFPFRKAAATGIGVALLVSTVGTVFHARAHNVHLGLAMVLLIGAGISAQVGAVMTSRLPARTLRKGMAALVAVTVVVIVGDLWARLR